MIELTFESCVIEITHSGNLFGSILLGERLERAILLFRGTTMAPSAIFAAQQLDAGYDPIPPTFNRRTAFGGGADA